ncbi:MAG: N-acetylglucosamine-6-phosphate deacetylase [Cephaloticoccus sp.]|nr:N-acetylglucosamine-6-phosphate deacetylase [Cephaloticoccus sp.]
METTAMKGTEYPGFFDLQVNGFGGVDFQQPALDQAALTRAVDGLLSHQTDRILFTLITDRIDALCAKLVNIETLRARDPKLARVIVGYHIEGPYMSPKTGYHGAHDPALMKAPDIAEFELLQEAAQGRIRLITLAPEQPNSAEFIRHITQSKVVAAIGHSEADDRQIDEAIAAGLSMCTHLGNGIPVQLHRHDNIMQRLLARDELVASFIPDGIHIPGPVLRNLVRAKPRDKVIFTTDCMAAAGAGPGRFRIGRFDVDVGVDGVVREPGKPNFAGSSLTMDRAAENIRTFLGWSEAEVHAACAQRVADSLGM